MDIPAPSPIVDDPPPAEPKAERTPAKPRPYVILTAGPADVDGAATWRNIGTVEATSAEGALREAVATLDGMAGAEGPGGVEAVAVTERSWKPKVVRGEVKRRVAIS